MIKTDLRVQKTYKLLYEALSNLLTEKSYEDITITEICNEAGVHRVTFYKHFSDKNDFLNSCLTDKINKLGFDTSLSSFTPESMKESCMNMLEQLLDFVEENKELLIKIKQNKGNSISSVLNECISNFLIAKIKGMSNICEKLGDSIYIIANFYAGAIVGLIRWWIDADTSLSRMDIINFSELKVDDLILHFNSII